MPISGKPNSDTVKALEQVSRQPAPCTITKSAILSGKDRDWLTWARQWQQGATDRNIEELSLSKAKNLGDVFKAYQNAAKKLACGQLVVSVGHGGIGTSMNTQDHFNLWPKQNWPWDTNTNRIANHDITEEFINYLLYGQYTSEEAQCMSKNCNHDMLRRVEKGALFISIGNEFRTAGVSEVVLLTCKVGASTSTFVQDVAKIWGVRVRAWLDYVGVRQVGSRIRAGLYDINHNLIYDRPEYETQLPLLKNCKPSTVNKNREICEDATVVKKPKP